MTDGDWFEQRVIDNDFRSVAYIETIQVEEVDEAAFTHPVWSSKRSLALEIEAKIGIPTYVVWHNPDCSDFLVLRLSETRPRRMNADEYKSFIQGLGRSR